MFCCDFGFWCFISLIFSAIVLFAVFEICRMLLFYYWILYAYDDVCDVRVEELRSCYYHIEVSSSLYLCSRRSYIGVGRQRDEMVEYVMMCRATYGDWDDRLTVGWCKDINFKPVYIVYTHLNGFVRSDWCKLKVNEFIEGPLDDYAESGYLGVGIRAVFVKLISLGLFVWAGPSEEFVSSLHNVSYVGFSVGEGRIMYMSIGEFNGTGDELKVLAGKSGRSLCDFVSRYDDVNNWHPSKLRHRKYW